MRARLLRDRARREDRRAAAIPSLLALVRDYPRIEEFQKIVARLLAEMDDERAFAAWLGINLRFPESLDAFGNLIAASRRRGQDTANFLLKARFPRMPRRLDQLLAYAEACDMAGEMVARRTAFDRLATIFGKRHESWLLATAWLEEEVGVHQRARGLLRRLAGGKVLGPPIIRTGKRLLDILGDSDGGNRLSEAAPVPSVRVLGSLFDRVLEGRPSALARPVRRKAPALLLTGSLGAGGAERQLVTTAVGLTAFSEPQRTLSNGLMLDPVMVMARSLRDRADGAFYLADLQQANLDVRSYREVPDFSGDLAASAVRPALPALGFLPWSTAEAIIKLTDHLRSVQPEIVHIWQDGLVYAAGLAALLAGVPRIILSGRSTPPPDRRERYLIEYDIIYRSLLRAPGVRLSVNSRHAAGRYAAWLGIDANRITVIPNGVAAPSPLADTGSQSLYEAFDERTGQGNLTVGAIMRLDEVKRPLLWIEAAAGIAAKLPDARFILVGDGPYRSRVEKRAQALGIASRCLFVGRSSCVGYWLTKVDVVLLLSEHEGLPNALIEAQLAGVPVITSPAGGAPETLVPDETGFVTSPTPTPSEVGELLAHLVAQPGRLQAMGLAAKQWATNAFPVSRMLSRTMDLYDAAGTDPGDDGTCR